MGTYHASRGHFRKVVEYLGRSPKLRYVVQGVNMLNSVKAVFLGAVKCSVVALFEDMTPNLVSSHR